MRPRLTRKATRSRHARAGALVTAAILFAAFSTGTAARQQPPSRQHATLIELGRHLFYDIRLSGPGYMSCASCHKPEKAFTDGRPVAIGVTGERHTRNTPTLANVGDLKLLGWANPAPQSLEAQMLRPLFSETPVEMGTRGHETPVLLHISSNAVYRELFEGAFPAQPAPINFDNITRAIAAFQRTLISRDSPYDRFAAGDRNALSPEARQGLALFTGERAKCSQCHQPPHFTDQRFHNTGLYNADGTGDLPGTDKGLANETGQTADTGRFRTPTLRNITVTAPYMRDGSITSLGDVIAHYAAGGQAAVGAKPSPRRSPLVAGFKISEAEKRHLLRFLESLTDERFLTKPELQTPFR